MPFKIKVDKKRRAALTLIADVNRGLLEAWLKMKAGGVTKSEIAKTLDKDKSFITRWLGQPRNMTLATLGELSYALGTPVRIEFGEQRVERAPSIIVRPATNFFRFGAPEIVTHNTVH